MAEIRGVYNEALFKEAFGAGLRELLLKLGCSETMLAKELHTSRQALNLYMHGRTVPNAILFLRALGLGMNFPGMRVEFEFNRGIQQE